MGELILTKARELFFSYGLKSVSMDDLAKLSGVTKKTIYQFFTDKNELVNQIVDELIQCHHKQLTVCMTTAKDAIEEVLMQSNEPFGLWSSVNQCFFYELEKSFPEAWKKIDQYRQQVFLPCVVRNLESGIEQGIYRNELHVAFAADVRIHQLNSVLLSNVFTNNRINAAQAANELTIFYLHGITTQKGKKLLNKYLKNRNEDRSTN